MTNELLKVQNLRKHFDLNTGWFKKKQTVKAVDNVSFHVNSGETLGIVGESGCGKSTLGRLLLRLIDPSEGHIIFAGKKLTDLSGNDLKKERKQFQMIFQDPYASLNPRMSIEEIMTEPLETHQLHVSNRKKKILELLDAVGMPTSSLDRYPHEFSGGQRQRIGIARALAVEPSFIVADEPVAALDVSIQAQILNLLVDLQKEFGLTYLFIAHDLSVVQYISDRIGVMYLGELVELSENQELYNNPLHPYTKALLSAIPIPDPFVKKQKVTLTGDIPSPVKPPAGCKFHTRCPFATEECKRVKPEWREVSDGHFIACHMV